MSIVQTAEKVRVPDVMSQIAVRKVETSNLNAQYKKTMNNVTNDRNTPNESVKIKLKCENQLDFPRSKNHVKSLLTKEVQRQSIKHLL